MLSEEYVKNGTKLRLLILSISVLILLIVIYVGTGKNSGAADAPSFAATVKEKTAGLYSQFTGFIGEKREKLKESVEEYKVRKQAIDFLMNPIRKNPVISDNDALLENSTEEITSSDEISEIEAETITSQKSKEICIEGLNIPSEVLETYFRSMNDYVYASAETNLYDSPLFEEKIAKAEKWERLLRVGISLDCCYQLVTKDGLLVYADGTHFKRNREDMPLTEVIAYPSESVLLPVKYISQFPSLPNGCEITSLATVLSFYGFEVDKDELSEKYLPMKPVGKANFYEEFVGDPSNRNSYGCFAPAIVEAGDKFLTDMQSELRVKDLTGCSFTELLEYVNANTPVILWGAAYIDSEPSYSSEWIVDGEYFIWKTNMHCMVLIGYNEDSDTVVVSDPMRGIKEYDTSLFVKRFKQFYSQALVLE